MNSLMLSNYTRVAVLSAVISPLAEAVMRSCTYGSRREIVAVLLCSLSLRVDGMADMLESATACESAMLEIFRV